MDVAVRRKKKSWTAQHPEEGDQQSKNHKHSGGGKLQSVRVGVEPEDFWWEPSEKVKRQSGTISPDALAGEAAAQPAAL